MKINEIKTRIDEFKAIKSKGSITPQLLGTLLEDMLTAIEANVSDSIEAVNDNIEAVQGSMEEVNAKIDGTDISGTLTQGTLFAAPRVGEQIYTAGASGRLQLAAQLLHLKKGQRFYATKYKLPGTLIMVDSLEEGAVIKDVYNTNSPYNIDYTASEDVSFVVLMSNYGNTIDTLDYSITGPGLEERVSELETKVSALPDNFDVFTILDVNVGTSKTQFENNENFTKVWNAMLSNEEVPVAVRVNYASGLKVMYYATCVKQGYISLHAKAGSCELKVIDDASFTITGTSLW